MTKEEHPVAPLKAPFPYFGGKSRVADEVWRRLGNVDNYLEPFGGSLAVLLARPHEHQWWLKKETVGDYAGHVVNFYRAIAAEPTMVAQHANWPVTEADLTARHLFLVRYQNELAEKLAADPIYYDARAAGWWVWGLSCWIGGDWLTGAGPWKPGVQGSPEEKKKAPGVYRKMPMIAGSHGGKGIHKPLTELEINPALGFPELDNDYLQSLVEQFSLLQNRLRRVRISCGDWSRLTGAAVDAGGKRITGVFLDPPYDLDIRRGDLYGANDRVKETTPIHVAARTWALEHGGKSNRRIAYCSYSTPEEDAIFKEEKWKSFTWSAHGGYGLQADNLAKSNREREIIWFSPYCLD